MAPDRGQNTDWIQANGGFRILRSWKRSGHRFITLYYPVCYLTISIMSNIGRNKNDFVVFLSNEPYDCVRMDLAASEVLATSVLQ